MCGAEQRVKVIETFVRFGCSAVDVVVELGYLNRHTVRNWWKERQLGGDDLNQLRFHRRGNARCSYHGKHGNRLVDGNGTDSDSLDGHDRLPVAVERFVADEHGDVRSHGVSHHVGDL